jgi:hypothetical protein
LLSICRSFIIENNFIMALYSFLSLFLSLSFGALATVVQQNTCEGVALVVDALMIQSEADAFCASLLKIPTVTLSVTQTTPMVSVSDTLDVETSTSGVTVLTAATATTIVPSVS